MRIKGSEMSDIKRRVLAAAAAQEEELQRLADIEEGETELELAAVYLPGEDPEYIRRVFSKSGKLLREERLLGSELKNEARP